MSARPYGAVMTRLARRLSVIVVATALLIVVLGATESASAKKAKPLKVTCDQLYAEVAKTAGQLRDQFNAQGFTIDPDGFLVGEACRKFGKRTRQGVGFMGDIHHSSDSDPPFPGETNPDVLEYHWIWRVTVTVTNKRQLVDTVSDLRCVKDIYTQLDVQEVPC